MSQDGMRPEFGYFLSSNNSILVVTFVGDMDDGPAANINLSKCKEEIEGFDDVKLVILYFRDVNHLSQEAVSMLTKIQLSIRSRGCHLSLSSLKPSIKERLLKLGVVRASETSDNLQAALQAFSLKVKRSAA